MSTRVGLWAVGAAALIVSMNAGCYYDQLLQEQRANRVLQEQLTRAKDDLHDAESMNQQLNTKIDSLNGQLAANKQTIDSLSAENESLRDKWGKAMAALEKMAGQPVGDTVVVNQVLPKELDEALRALGQQYPGVLEYLPEKGAVRWKSDLVFPLGSDVVSESVAEPLRKFAEILRSTAATNFDAIVVGHTCNTRIARPETLREHKTNWHLSAHRAISVMKALASDGVPETKMGVMGYGEWRPIAPNDTEANKAKNRRVEIFLVSSEKVMTTGTAGVYETTNKNMSFVKTSDLGGAAKESSPPTRTAPKVSRKAKPKAAPAAAPTAAPKAEAMAVDPAPAAPKAGE
jgi:chemotaxis protein MotB